MAAQLPQTGVYLVECLRQRLEKASTGTAQFVVEFRTVGRYDTNRNLVPCPPLEGKYQHSLKNDASVLRLRADLRPIGLLDDLTRLTPGIPGGVTLIGKRINMNCSLEPFGGRIIPRWSIERNEAMTQDEIARLQELYGNLLRETNPQSASSESGSEEPVVETVSYPEPALAAEPVAA